MWIALAIKPIALAVGAAGLLWVRRYVQRRMPDSRLKRVLLWPGEARDAHRGTDDPGGGRPGAQ